MHLVEELLREPGERAAFLDDPNAYLPSRGFEEFTADDVELSLQLASDSFPPALAARIDPSAGLNTVTDIDIDEVPGLWAPPSDGLDAISGLEDLASEPEPFFDDVDLDASQLDDVDLEADSLISDDLDEPTVEFDATGTSEGDLFGETTIPDSGLTDLTADFDVAFDDDVEDGLSGHDDVASSDLDALGDFADPEVDDFDGLDG